MLVRVLCSSLHVGRPNFYVRHCSLPSFTGWNRCLCYKLTVRFCLCSMDFYMCVLFFRKVLCFFFAKWYVLRRTSELMFSDVEQIQLIGLIYNLIFIIFTVGTCNGLVSRPNLPCVNKCFFFCAFYLQLKVGTIICFFGCFCIYGLIIMKLSIYIMLSNICLYISHMDILLHK